MAGNNNTDEKILILLGKTASGKSTLAKTLYENGFKKVITYTTRPKRNGEVDGVDYHFVTNDEFKKLLDEKKIVEYTSYNATFGKVYYGSHIDSYKPGKKVIILNPDGLKAVNELNIPYISFYLEVDESILSKRALERGDNPLEVVRRMKADNEDFENIKETVNYVLDGSKTGDELIRDILSVY